MYDMIKERAAERDDKTIGTDRRGSYNRNASGVAKPQSHAQYAWDHKMLIEGYNIGRPCLPSCPFGRKCGQDITPRTLQQCHEYSFGVDTTCQTDGDSVTYKCGMSKRQSMTQWRDLVLGCKSPSLAPLLPRTPTLPEKAAAA